MMHSSTDAWNKAHSESKRHKLQVSRKADLLILAEILVKTLRPYSFAELAKLLAAAADDHLHKGSSLTLGSTLMELAVLHAFKSRHVTDSPG